MELNGNRLDTDVIREITMIQRLAPATRKIRQRRLEANMGVPAGTLSELCLTSPISQTQPTQASAPKPKKKKAAKKTTAKKKTASKKKKS